MPKLPEASKASLLLSARVRVFWTIDGDGKPDIFIADDGPEGGLVSITT